VPEMAGAIAPLIDKRAQPLPPEQFKVAVFYSISNCQPGLRGVSLGNFLIKRVAEQLKRELPQLKTFCTLSPIPGFMAWLAKVKPESLPDKPARAHAELHAACGEGFAALTQAPRLAALAGAAHHALWRLAAFYLVQVSPQQSGGPMGDPVARFHLDNGARLERLNAQANLSPKGLKQSAGLMVNYLYDLARIERHHDRFAQGEVVASRAILALL
jgi:malonyl-CoA decarboxylase